MTLVSSIDIATVKIP